MERKVQTASKWLSLSRTATKAIAKKSEKDEKLFQKYEETIATYITQGNGKKMSQEEL